MYRIIIEANDKGTFFMINHGTAEDPDWFTESLPDGCNINLSVTEHRVEMKVLDNIDYDMTEARSD